MTPPFLSHEQTPPTWVYLLSLLFLGLMVKGGAQQPPPDRYRHRVDVELVLVPASVSTVEGQPVTTLEKDDFEVFENGEARTLTVFERKTALPLQLALLIDASLSAASELPAQKEAMMRFLERVLRPSDAAALYGFSGAAELIADFGIPLEQLRLSLKQIVPRGGTALYDVAVETSAKLKERQGRRVMVLITDGNDTTSQQNYHEALRSIQEAEVTVFALLVRPIPGESGRSVRGEHVLLSFAELTGGQVFFPAGAGEMDRFFDELNQLLRTQYLLGYRPAPPGGREEFRKIEVRIKGGGNYIVRHRKGYYMEPAS